MPLVGEVEVRVAPAVEILRELLLWLRRGVRQAAEGDEERQHAASHGVARRSSSGRVCGGPVGHRSPEAAGGVSGEGVTLPRSCPVD